MDNLNLWNFSPALAIHVFVYQTKQFQLKHDLYKDWAAFIVEEGSMRFRIDGVQGEATRGDIVLCPPGVLVERQVTFLLSFHFLRFTWRQADPNSERTFPAQAFPTGVVRSSHEKRLFHSLSQSPICNPKI